MKLIVQEWLEKAKEDLQTINEIKNNDYLTNIMSFHAQQAIGKCFKAIIEAYKIEFVKEHNLLTLYNKIKNYIDFQVGNQMLNEISKIYLTARYPGELGLLPEGKPSISDALSYYQVAGDIYNKTVKLLKNS
ncbi:HEPN domain-containing protein [Bacteroidota bacterium]